MGNIRRWSAGCVALATVLIGTVLLTAACTGGGTGYGRILANSSGTYSPPTPTPSTSQPPPPPAEVPTETHSGGKGQTSIQPGWPGEPGFLTFDCPKCSGNVIVESDGADGLLINAIGPYHGTRWLNVAGGRRVADIAVTTDASWTLTIADYRSLPVAELGKEMSGKGDAVLRIPAGTTKAALTSKGRGNFGVWVTTERSVELAVNEIGNYQNTRPMKGPAYVKIDNWDGTWTLTPS